MRTFNTLAILFILLCGLSLWACSEDDATIDGDSDGDLGESEDGDIDGDADSETDGELVVRPALPHAHCGMESYDLIDPDELGQVIEYEEDPLFNLGPDAIDGLLQTAGYDQLSPVPYGTRLFRYRYTTQDKGQVVEATAVLGIPANTDLPDGEMPWAIFHHGTTGFSHPCAPSRNGDGQAMAAVVAASGLVAVVPDYIGLQGFGTTDDSRHGYLVGEQVAIGSWDALRAAHKLLTTELTDLVDVGYDTVLWGGSQGGHACIFTELFGPYYAPEYHVAGVSAAVPPINILGLTEIAVTEFTAPAQTFPAVLTTMRNWYGMPADMSAVLVNEEPLYLADNAETIFYPQEECEAPEGMEEAITGIDKIYTVDFMDKVKQGKWDELEPWSCFLKESQPATSSVPMLRDTPILMSFSEDDDLVVTQPQREEFDRLCDAGWKLEYLECMNAGHSQGALWSLPEQLQWLRDRLNGEPMDEDRICQRFDPICCTATEKPEERCQ